MSKKYLVIVLLFLTAFSANSFAKTTESPWYQGTFNSYFGQTYKIDQCVIVTELLYREVEVNNYTVFVYCADYDDMLKVKEGSMSRIPVFPLRLGDNLSRSAMKKAIEYKGNWGTKWKIGNVWTITAEYWGSNAAAVREKLRNPNGVYMSENTYYKYFTTLKKLHSGDY